MRNILWVFFISMLPVVELRAAIPVGAALGMPFYLNAGAAILGNLLPVPFILLFIPRILDWLGKTRFFRPMVDWLRAKAEKQSDKIVASAFAGLLFFVMIPCPGTGAWTGSLIAALFGLPKKKALLAVTLGVLGCAVIMTLASYGVVGFLSFLAK